MSADWDLFSTQTSLGTHTYDLSLNMLGKCLVLRVPLRLVHDFTLQEPDETEAEMFLVCVWARASSSSLSTLDRVQKRIHVFVGDELICTVRPLSNRRDLRKPLAAVYLLPRKVST